MRLTHLHSIKVICFDPASSLRNSYIHHCAANCSVLRTLSQLCHTCCVPGSTALKVVFSHGDKKLALFRPGVWNHRDAYQYSTVCKQNVKIILHWRFCEWFVSVTLPPTLGNNPWGVPPSVIPQWGTHNLISHLGWFQSCCGQWCIRGCDSSEGKNSSCRILSFLLISLQQIAVSGTWVRKSKVYWKSFALPIGVDRLSILFYFSSYVLVRVISFWHDISVCWPSSGSKVFIVAAALMFQVDSGSRHGILLEVVQVVTDLDLTVTKAYISSDGRWFMVGEFRKLLQLCILLSYLEYLYVVWWYEQELPILN